MTEDISSQLVGYKAGSSFCQLPELNLSGIMKWKRSGVAQAEIKGGLCLRVMEAGLLGSVGAWHSPPPCLLPLLQVRTSARERQNLKLTRTSAVSELGATAVPSMLPQDLHQRLLTAEVGRGAEDRAARGNCL